jgi:hypothetical protein
MKGSSFSLQSLTQPKQGRIHDFKLFKRSRTHIPPNTVVLADLGYLGLARLHTLSCLPAKATKHHPLSYEEKQANRTLARLVLTASRYRSSQGLPRPLRALSQSL